MSLQSDYERIADAENLKLWHEAADTLKGKLNSLMTQIKNLQAKYPADATEVASHITTIKTDFEGILTKF